MRKPIVFTLLDKEAAFDSVRKEHIVWEAFIVTKHKPSKSLLYMTHRLSSQKTFLQYQSFLLSPIEDERGVVQGRVPVGPQFQLTTNRET